MPMSMPIAYAAYAYAYYVLDFPWIILFIFHSLQYPKVQIRYVEERINKTFAPARRARPGTPTSIASMLFFCFSHVLTWLPN